MEEYLNWNYSLIMSSASDLIIYFHSVIYYVFLVRGLHTTKLEVAYFSLFSLFQFAGAAQSLGAGALLVNPWNITEVANSIFIALTMNPEEREKRHRHNFAHVTTHTAQEWAQTFVR